jgi:hypothetical protein
LIESVVLCLLVLCIACPWVLWLCWGPWIGLTGILLSHVLYLILLAPKSGICLGIPWIFVFANSVLCLVALGAVGLWRLFT